MNTYKFIGAVFLLIALGFVFMNYGNVNSHPTINRLIVEKFVSVTNLGDISDFKNYRFKLYKPKLKGDFITKTGYFNPSNAEVKYVGDRSVGKLNSIFTEEVREVTPETWIEHGGFSADVPEVPASLRHFYDPTRDEGERYLSDDLNSPVMKFMESLLEKPKTNGVDWALGTEGNFGVLEHVYTWEHGKQYMKGALEQSNLDKRNNYMAKAWRSLGETLHMIADNGCPVHVRNDGHPAFLVNLFDVVELFGNPDPYEEQMEVKDIRKFDVGSIPFDLRDKFRKAKTAREIAHELAVFTNENFFTNETISGIDWRGNTVIPITNPTYIHKSPKISLKNYDDKYYRRKIGKKEVLLCTDKWFFGEYNIPSRIPHIDEDCVVSQAKVLIPTIKEAGMNVMKLFIPKISITITNIDEDGNISGIVQHKTDKEYSKEIRYNGPVKIRSGRSVITTLNASGGKFSGQIEVEGKTKVTAGIEFGGIEVYSKQVSIDLKKEKKDIYKIDAVSIKVWCGDALFEDLYFGDVEDNIRPTAIGIIERFEESIIKNNKISAASVYDDDYLTVKQSLVLKFSDNNRFNSLNGFSFKKTWAQGSGGELPEDGTTIIDGLCSAEGNDIPFNMEYGRNNYFKFIYKGNISKYLSNFKNRQNSIFKSSDKTIDKVEPEYHVLKKCVGDGEIEIEIHFSNQIVNLNDILND